MFIKRLCAFGALAMATMFSVFGQSHSGTLPVLYVTTENNEEITSKEYYLTASYYLDNNGDATIESIGTPENPETVQIKARGNFSWWGFDKKPYKLKFPSKIEFMGMDKNKHFALLAHADDDLGFMRNIAGFELSRRMGLDWTPADKPVEFYLNGDYKGLYFVTQTVRIDKTRVNITEQEDLATTDVDGGWLVEIDNYDTDPHIDVTEPGGFPIYFTYKSPEELSNEQEEYLTAQLNAINNAIYNADKSSDEWLEYIDLESAARFYIVQELMDDCESYHGSCYIYKDRGEGAKWKFGPVWDFGNAHHRGDKNKFIWQDAMFHQTWIGEIYKYPVFQQKVRELWKEFCESGYEGYETFINEYVDRFAEASLSDYQRWPQYGHADVRRKAENYLALFRSSVNWLGEQWGSKPAVDPEVDPDVYLRGSFNGWQTTDPLVKLGGMCYEISVGATNMKAGDEFKVGTADWYGVNLGAPDAGMSPALQTEFSLVHEGCNIIAPEGLTPEHVLTVDCNNRTLSFTSPSGVDEVGDMTDDETPVIYTITGQKVDSMEATGIYLLRYSDRTVKVLK